ncbi:hypothetical protein PHYSODRAFT_327908 [Phytophthora sojae]|uniref:VPS9 domain-containing protein n=1 Tax=Phytophthora sojae (strain P6497) TaxID=1094619 RepID=G4Z8U2_PHYSP|nr:hypothetical protein PHYSODRAFT_327908 [Phytophthora sojae]EGZ19713.1 hypothetical protein PHYSODRAFT_327908 [Phytophthora sojae]|eukprot:XP_009522430.1 hypothetical protein PHYSODRAFT_327908 [Phytophthora sojae]
MRDAAVSTPEDTADLIPQSPASSSSSAEEGQEELLDSVCKIDSALLRQEQLSSTASEESANGMSNQSEEGGAVSRDDVEQLRRSNEHLRREVADLTSALLARDLELAGLRERCQFLSTAVEQQDEVIAKIYAATAANEADRELSEPAAGSTLSGFAPSKDKLSSGSKQNEQSSTFSSMKSYPGAVGMAEPAQKMLEARLDSMGFQGDSVEKAVESLREDLPTELEKLSENVANIDLGQLPYTPRVASSSNNFSATASVYSSSSTATASSSSSLFGDVGEPVSKPPRSWSSPRSPVSIVKRRPSLERHDNSPTEEVFARSAGFLRKSNRTMSGRLSVSDLGLLHNDDDEDLESNQASEVAPFSIDQDDCLGFADSGSSTVSTRSRSQRNLFADIDEALKAKSKQKNSDPVGGDKADEDSLTYGEFLQRISLPASRDILDKIRMFVGSILGPRGDGRPPRSTDYVEYDFYGKHEFRRRCNRFFETMEEILLNHPAWRHASEGKLAKARDGIEKYVMDKVSDIAFNQLKECQQWMKEDEALLRRMQLLSFITPAMLDIKPCMRNEVVWSMAEDELRRINSFRSPGDKINCIVRCCSVIFSVLNLSRGDSGSRPGADDFLPVFIYIVLHSQIPRLHSNCEYISAYRNQADLMSKAGYCFVNLRSAIEFIMVMDGSMLSISDDEFQRKGETLAEVLNGQRERMSKAAVKFKPLLAVHKFSCVTFPAVNSAGETSGGLKGTNYNKGCTSAPLGSQVYGRARWFKDVWAIMYAWYFPKGFWDADRRHNWASAVVWIDNPALETPKALGLSLSKSDTKYNHLAPVSLPNATTPYLQLDAASFSDFEMKSIEFALGSSQDLIMWEQLTGAARAALNDPKSFGESFVPMSDTNFPEWLEKAWPFKSEE